MLVGFIIPLERSQTYSAIDSSVIVLVYLFNVKLRWDAIQSAIQSLSLVFELQLDLGQKGTKHM